MTRRVKSLFQPFWVLLPLAAAVYLIATRWLLWRADSSRHQTTGMPAEETVLPADIRKLMEKGEIHNAVLLNNFEGRLMDQSTKTLKGNLAALGTPVNPGDVMIISDASVPDEMVDLYTSITRLPDAAEVVRILYTLSADRKKATLLGYTVERPRGTEAAFVRYDGSTPWLEWVTASFPAVNAKLESARSLSQKTQ
ncbi:MAG TPA: hypothetical protein VG796_21350 [Verrucomicrobiales bacterium]|nr:hypothetical protein [Verrucomicrobiales bacterium]